jgi:hypothetical protein
LQIIVVGKFEKVGELLHGAARLLRVAGIYT